jgi:hypothetical protein
MEAKVLSGLLGKPGRTTITGLCRIVHFLLFTAPVTFLLPSIICYAPCGVISDPMVTWSYSRCFAMLEERARRAERME